MSLTDTILLFLAFFSVWLPVLVAFLARRSPIGVRVVLALSGVGAGIYAFSTSARIPHAGGHERGWGFLLVPFTTAALSFFLAFTGICAVTALHYIVAGRSVSAPSFLAFSLLAACIVLGIFVVFPFLSWPTR
jgi:hypothetical protein